jgi:hypothetical protein
LWAVRCDYGYLVSPPTGTARDVDKNRSKMRILYPLSFREVVGTLEFGFCSQYLMRSEGALNGAKNGLFSCSSRLATLKLNPLSDQLLQVLNFGPIGFRLF